LNCFDVVRQFEAEVAKFAGSKYAVAMNTGTSAIFLSMKYVFTQKIHPGGPVCLPAKTFISVPMAVLQAGGQVQFKDYVWSGVYQLEPHPVWDGALRFRKDMYQGGLHCLSFHARKILNIGEGGMVLTDDKDAADWLRKANYSGRSGLCRVEDVDSMGWQMYMTPEKAARGLHLMQYLEDEADQVVEYPDLRKVPFFCT
jgi:dTDP-4-amino-4,6-dideoxygalactose transaminase